MVKVGFFFHIAKWWKMFIFLCQCLATINRLGFGGKKVFFHFDAVNWFNSLKALYVFVLIYVNKL